MNGVGQTHSRAAMYNGYMPPAGPWALGMPVPQQNPNAMPHVQLPSQVMNMQVKEQFKCDLCAYSSTKKENLARHKYLRGHGQGDPHGEALKCHKCDFRANAVVLKEHARSVHGEEMKRHKCHLCQYSSTRKENLTRHMKQHSKGESMRVFIMS